MTTPPIPSDEPLDRILKQYSTHVQHGHAEIGLPIAKEAIQIYFAARQKAAVDAATLEARIDTIARVAGTLSFEGIKLTPEQEESLAIWRRQLEAQRPTESVEGEE